MIEKLRPGALGPGDTVHVDGTVIGRHEGIINYTVGQRKGLGIGGNEEPLFVVRLDAAKKQVVVGPKEALLTRSFVIRECNWLDGELKNWRTEELEKKELFPNFPIPQFSNSSIPQFSATVKLRSAHPGVSAAIEPLGGMRARVTLAEAQGAVSPGQACVVYDGERMLGGGWIASSQCSG